jgi:hypothetical protein
LCTCSMAILCLALCSTVIICCAVTFLGASIRCGLFSRHLL